MFQKIFHIWLQKPCMHTFFFHLSEFRPFWVSNAKNWAEPKSLVTWFSDPCLRKTLIFQQGAKQVLSILYSILSPASNANQPETLRIFLAILEISTEMLKSAQNAGKPRRQSHRGLKCRKINHETMNSYEFCEFCQKVPPFPGFLMRYLNSMSATKLQKSKSRVNRLVWELGYFHWVKGFGWRVFLGFVNFWVDFLR